MRVAIESALQAPANTVGMILIDEGQFAPAVEAALKLRADMQTRLRPTVQLPQRLLSILGTAQVIRG